MKRERGGTSATLAGRASAEGTTRYAARHGARFSADFFRALDGDAIRLSSIGIGTYLGACDDADDARYAGTARRAMDSGINLLDTAINYRCQRSERTIGRALAHAVRSGAVARDEIVLSTKGGYIPLDGVQPPSREEYQHYLAREYFEPGIMAPDDIVAGGHCLAPSYLANQIARSRANLGVATIDIYYLHNPEQQLDVLSWDALRERLRAAFALLEERCAAGEIGSYGCATWSGFRVAPDAPGHLSLAALVELAREVAGERHHLRVIQLPINLSMSEAVRVPTQRLPGGHLVSTLQAAAELGVATVASATLMQARLAQGLPQQLREALPGLSTDAQRAISFVRSLPVVTSALVGMKTETHLAENLVAGR